MKLSLLVCSITSRADLLGRLMGVLRPQLVPDVEVLTSIDEGVLDPATSAPVIPVGRKRNELLDRAQGDYIAFVDDDDLVSSDYVTKILEAIQTGPDCCGMEGEITFDGKNPRKFIHSLRYDHWFEKDNVYYRNPNHLSPVKRLLAVATRFPDISYVEDREYSKNLLPRLKTEVYIPGIIYYYLYVGKK